MFYSSLCPVHQIYMHQCKLFNLPEPQCSLLRNVCILFSSGSHIFYALAHIFLAHCFAPAMAAAITCA